MENDWSKGTGNWIDANGWEIAPMNMSDDCLGAVIVTMAMGGGRGPGVVLGCIDEIYGTARARGLFGRWRAFVAKKYTKWLWTRGLSRIASGRAKRLPRFVAWTLKDMSPLVRGRE